MTLLESARRGMITEEIREVAEREGLDPEKIRRGVASGRIVIPRNEARERENVRLCAIGEGTRTKVNANIGTSPEFCDLDLELRKLRVAERYGADTVMDLSTGGDLDLIRRRLLEESKLPFGTVPIYQAGIEARIKKGSVLDMDEDLVFSTIEKHARDGVDFVTVHSAINREILEILERRRRLMGVVSRGGSFILAWMHRTGEENPLYRNFDYLLEIAREYDLTLSLGDAMRPGCIEDAHDRAQLEELHVISRQVEACLNSGVQVMVEGPGHMPMDKIYANVRLQKELCRGVPYYVLGPLVTDVAPGYDHIAAAIGGALAAMYGADFLCYVTPAEHIGFPMPEDVREGVIAARIAAHAADLVKGFDRDWDRNLSRFRALSDWENLIRLSMDPEKVREMLRTRNKRIDRFCAMCGEYCALRISESIAIRSEEEEERKSK